MDGGIPWPVSMGIAGVSVAALVSVLVWLIRRQASGDWYTATQVAAIIAEKDKTIAVYVNLATTWQEANTATSETLAETAVTLRQSVEANRSADRAFDLLLRGAGITPPTGDNGTRTEGASAL